MSKRITDLFRCGWRILKENRIEGYGLDTRLILQFVLNVDVNHIISHSNEIVDEKNEKKFFDLIKKRQKHKPIAQIIGYKEFWKHKFFVNKSTLIPRPETELLIEEILKIFPNQKEKLYFADFGAGTGCIGLSLLNEYFNSKCLFVEKSQNAMSFVKKNARALKLSNHCVFQNTSWNNLKIQKKFDFIVSNPPYISKSRKNELMIDVVKFEPSGALFANDYGLKAYHEILKCSKDFLKPHGYLFFEIDSNYLRICVPQYYKLINIVNDLANLPRVMILQFSGKS